MQTLKCTHVFHVIPIMTAITIPNCTIQLVSGCGIFPVRLKIKFHILDVWHLWLSLLYGFVMAHSLVAVCLIAKRYVGYLQIYWICQPANNGSPLSLGLVGEMMVLIHGGLVGTEQTLSNWVTCNKMQCRKIAVIHSMRFGKFITIHFCRNCLEIKNYAHHNRLLSIYVWLDSVVSRLFIQFKLDTLLIHFIIGYVFI
jgi:hypothetical protein